MSLYFATWFFYQNISGRISLNSALFCLMKKCHIKVCHRIFPDVVLWMEHLIRKYLHIAFLEKKETHHIWSSGSWELTQGPGWETELCLQVVNYNRVAPLPTSVIETEGPLKRHRSQILFWEEKLLLPTTLPALPPYTLYYYLPDGWSAVGIFFEV